MIGSFLLAFAGSLLMGIGAPLYKKCTERVGKISVEKFLRDPKGMISRLVFNLTFLAAVLFGFGGWVLWLSGLSGLEAMIGGPILAAMYITSLLVARFYLGERLTPREGMGLGILLLGILVLGFAGGAG
ncbi:MAG: EamA family transporter [Candidatus Hadarchaeales archaeon]